MRFEQWGMLKLETPGWHGRGPEICSWPGKCQVGWEAGQGRGDRDPSDILTSPVRDSGKRCPNQCCKVRLWSLTPLFVSSIFKYAMRFSPFSHESLHSSICHVREEEPAEISQNKDLVWWLQVNIRVLEPRSFSFHQNQWNFLPQWEVGDCHLVTGYLGLSPLCMAGTVPLAPKCPCPSMAGTHGLGFLSSGAA